MDVDDKIWLGAVLSALGVCRMEANLSGGGDSGNLDDITYWGKENAALDYAVIDTALREMTVDCGAKIAITFHDRLDEMIMEDASDIGNYYDQDGGSVWLSYAVDTEGILIEASSFIENEYDDDDPEYDDEEPELDDEDQLVPGVPH